MPTAPRTYFTMQLRARYSAFSRLSSMVFSISMPSGVPTSGDCMAVIERYITWETLGLGFLGYQSIRSTASALVDVRAWSIDPRGGGEAEVAGLAITGLLPPLVALDLPSTLAPIVKWDTVPPRRIRPRTYATCVALTGGGHLPTDPQSISALHAVEVQATFNALVEQFNGPAYFLSALDWSGKSPLVLPGQPFIIPFCSGVKQLLGSQRRRTFSGRG